jgi:ABC-type dipeptide/oligopeptide/nickel transport system ATPase component
MDHGAIVEEGPPKVVFTAPRSPRTRQFLQSILNRNGEAEEEPQAIA